jgi:hypothetical protein
MKANYRISFLLIVLASGMFSSCSKWLELQPQDGITRQEFWQTKEQIESTVVGCYSSLLGPPTGNQRPLSEFLFLWGELRADMVAPGLGITNDELDVMNVNTLATNAVTDWSAVYRTINYCNTVIEFAPGVLQKDNTLTQTKLNQSLSEAYALRALMYFYLVRSFRDVPLKVKSTANDVDLIQLPKSSSDTVLAQILTDLKFADNNIAISYGRAYDKGRITKYTVKAILADVYLWMENYTECVAACDFIINSGQFGLVAGNSGWFSNLYYTGNSNEAIFELQYDVQKLNSFYGLFATSRQRYLASPRVMDEIYTIDYQDDTNKDIRGEGAAVRTSDNAIWKYIGIDFNSIRPQDASYAHWIMYRYADVLLMKAEALNQIGGKGDEALQLVNRIRTRAGALAQTNANPDVTDKTALGDYILAERAREFAFEGKRWYDILRNAKRNKYERLSLLLTMVSKTAPAASQQSAIGKYRDQNSHYFPINQYEIQTDPNLIQNPFYK